MAGSVNRVILIGRLGKDPETSYLPSGQSVTKFSLATSRVYKDKNGEKKEETDWHNIVAWGKTGEICQKYLTKGGQLFLEGRIQNRNWEDKEGKKHYATDIVAENITLLGSKGDGGNEGSRQGSPAAGPRSSPKPSENDFGAGPEITDDDIPF